MTTRFRTYLLLTRLDLQSPCIAKRFIFAICFIMCITGCGKGKNLPLHTHNVKWGYAAENGPAVWGQLSQEYILCGEGTHQSPIDLVNPTPTELPPISYEYNLATGVNIHHNGHTIEVAYPEGSGIQIDGTDYQLLQFHFHAPSEHTVDGKPFDMEMHLVHENEDGNLAVVGLLIESGRHHPAFDPIWASLPSTPLETQRIENVTVDLPMMLSPNRQVHDESVQAFPSTYRYNGSLTTPPCSEGVKWIVLTTPVEMSESQIAAFKAIIYGNNRPVQPLNGRELLLDATGAP